MPRTAVLSNSKLNTHGFRVLTEGIQLGQYHKNPLLLWMHNRPFGTRKDDVNVIGRIENVRLEGDNLLGDLVFDNNDEFAKSIEQKWDNNFLRMVSVGLEAVEWSEDVKHLVQGQTRATLVKSKLLEVSVVDMGANDDALALYSADGAVIKLSVGMDGNIPTIINKKTKKMELIALALGLSGTASEAEIVQKITELSLEAAELIQLRTVVETQMNESIAAEVKKAIELKKITEDKNDHFVSLGKKCGLESLKLTFSSMSSATVSRPTDVILKTSKNTIPGGKSAVKLSDVPESELDQLRADDPTEYARLYKAEYGISLSL